MPNSATAHPGHAALRRGRASRPSQVYLMTFATHGRKPLFADWIAATVAARALTDARLWECCQLQAWVLMPDHWHGLITLGDDGDLSAVVQRLKSNVAREVRRVCPQVRRVWAAGFHDHALRAEEDMVDVARYIVRNPVAGGLVKRVGDYPYWDAAWV